MRRQPPLRHRVAILRHRVAILGRSCLWQLSDYCSSAACCFYVDSGDLSSILVTRRLSIPSDAIRSLYLEALCCMNVSCHAGCLTVNAG